MISKEEQIHTYYLDHLVARLNEVDEDRHDLVSIIKEPLWTPNSDLNPASLCDLILIYYDRTTVPIELKGNIKQQHKARKQVRQGFKYSNQVLQMEPRYGKVVIYHPHDMYEFLRMNYRGGINE